MAFPPPLTITTVQLNQETHSLGKKKIYAHTHTHTIFDLDTAKNIISWRWRGGRSVHRQEEDDKNSCSSFCYWLTHNTSCALHTQEQGIPTALLLWMEEECKMKMIDLRVDKQGLRCGHHLKGFLFSFPSSMLYQSTKCIYICPIYEVSFCVIFR